MTPRPARALYPALIILLAAILACNLPGGAAQSPTTEPGNPPEAGPTPAETPAVPASTPTPAVVHTSLPSNAPPPGRIVYDVESSGTAAERRAPYGDSYDINRLERPFLQDMTYVPDLDIVTFNVSSDETFWYVSIELIGADPNNTLGIDYGVELDLDHDGFGEYAIWARGPYPGTWDTLPVKIYEDQNHDTGGLSGEKSDAPLEGDGYETQIFNGGPGDTDPDMAWVRAGASSVAAVQFAIKKSLTGTVFMIGVIADANLKDPGQLDYVDRFTEAEAGSPIKDKPAYPLKALFAVDNTCREAFGFNPTGYEPQLCPREPPATRQPRTPVAPSPTPYVPIIF